LKDPVKQDQINKALWRACDSFRGTLDPSIYKDYVLTMLFVKALSDVWLDHREEYQKEHGDHPDLIRELMNNERFVLPPNANFNSLYEHRHEQGNGERIDKALHAIEEANIQKLNDVFQDISFNANKLGDETQKNEILKALLENFHKPELNLRPSRIGRADTIGNAYEFLIAQFAATSGKKASEFYTPGKVSELIAELLAPRQGDEICDPACGSGSLLLKCANRIERAHSGSRRFALYGQEAIGSTWALAKMNMFLHGVDNHRIEWGDTLRNPRLLEDKGRLKLFDVVVANPPFSLDKWGHEVASDDPHSRFRRGVPPKTKGDYAFILHMIETLKPETGRMGVVVPHGVLFRGSSEGRIRRQLIEENLLDAVIGLPEKLFFGTGIPAAVLVFRQDKADDNVLFIDASREFQAGKNRNTLTDDNLRKIVETYTARKDVDQYAHLATPAEIAGNDFNLNIPRYVDTFEEEKEINLMSVRAEREHLKQKLAALEQEMEGYLKGLGYGS